jgi:Uri superfamily endonuclease
MELTTGESDNDFPVSVSSVRDVELAWPPNDGTMPTPTATPGTYALVLAATKRQVISVGKLGTFEVWPGFYVYVGSALGPGGLAARIGRHARQEKTLRWHVDYLRVVTDLVEVWFGPGRQRRECSWAARLAVMSGAEIRRLGFGSSDCGCRSHLVYFRRERPVPTIDGIEVWRFAS